MYPVAEQVRCNRIVKGVSIPHPCGDPSLPPEFDARLRREIVQTALKALEAEVKGPTLFTPNMTVSG
jgi:glycine reductase